MTVTVPAVTVLMAAHNAARWLRETIASVVAQDFASFEFVIVDDGSRDATQRILAEAAALDPRIRIVTLRDNIGLTAALNRGLAVATAPLVARIDADDRCFPQRLSRQVRAFDLDPKLTILGSGYRLVDASGRVLGTLREALDEWQAHWLSGFSTPAPHPSFCFRRIAPSGEPVRYDEGLSTAQDFDLWSRMAAMGKSRVLGEPLIDYRRHSSAITVRRRREQAENVARIGSANLRRRLPSPIVDEISPLVDLLAYRAEARGVEIARAVAACEAILEYDMIRAPLEHRSWLRRTAAGLLADAVLLRGGALARPVDLARFLWHARGLLPAVAGAALARPVTARKAVTAFFSGTWGRLWLRRQTGR